MWGGTDCKEVQQSTTTNVDTAWAFEKIDLQENHGNLTAAEFQLLINLWDKEVTQLMLGSENRCNKFRDGNIDFYRF